MERHDGIQVLKLISDGGSERQNWEMMMMALNAEAEKWNMALNAETEEW